VSRFELQEDLAGLLRCSVDLVDLRSASTVLRMQVLRPCCNLVTLNDRRRMPTQAEEVQPWRNHEVRIR
jgi:hypothetical protein